MINFVDGNDEIISAVESSVKKIRSLIIDLKYKVEITAEQESEIYVSSNLALSDSHPLKKEIKKKFIELFSEKIKEMI